VSIKCYVFVLHLDCDPQGCSRYLAMSHVAASLSRQYARYITPCFTLDNTDSLSAAMRDQLYDSRCMSICLQSPSQVHLSLVPIEGKEIALKYHSLINFFSTSWWENKNSIDLHWRRTRMSEACGLALSNWKNEQSSITP